MLSQDFWNGNMKETPDLFETIIAEYKKKIKESNNNLKKLRHEITNLNDPETEECLNDSIIKEEAIKAQYIEKLKSLKDYIIDSQLN